MAEKPTPKTQQEISSQFVIERALQSKSWCYKNKKE
jgi:hypothetical protein